jgi:ATP-dependent DNA helicase PIF1
MSIAIEERYPPKYEESDLYKLYPELYIEIFVKKRNVLLSGLAGCGKSFAIALIKKEALRLSIVCGITSTTGVSAHAIKGETIHRWSGIKLADKPLLVIIKNIRSKSEALKRWKKTQILVIDEVSMLGKNVLDIINKIGQEIRIPKKDQKYYFNNKISMPTFGGLQVIFSADFLQLMPVKDDFCFKSLVWHQLNLYNFRLIHPYRYADIDHFKMLTRIRVGAFTKGDIAKLRTRVKAYDDYKLKEKNGETEDIKPTRIYPLKKDVEAINLMELNKLEGDDILYEATDVITQKYKDDDFDSNIYVEIMDLIVNYELLLKVGAQVMLTSNLNVENGLVNGSRGVIIECHDERIVVKFRDDQVIDITPYVYEYEDEKVSVIRYQFPLILAWSISVHKCIKYNSIVATTEGLKQIYRLAKENQKSETFEPVDFEVYGRNDIRRVSTIYKGKIEKTKILNTKLGYSIEATLDHPLLVFENGKEIWKNVEDIKMGSYIILKSNIKSEPVEYITTNYIPPIVKIIYKTPPHVEDKLSYVIGLLIGDGSYNDTKDYTIEYCSEDKELIDIYCTYMKDLFGCKITIRQKKKNKLYRTHICSKYIRYFLIYCGLNYVTFNEKEVPWSIIENKLLCQKECIKGLFDTDGGVSERCIHFTNTSQKVIDVVQQLLLNNGIISSKRVLHEEEDNIRKAWRIQISGINARKYFKKIGFNCFVKMKLCEKQYGILPSIITIPKSNITSIPIELSMRIFKFIKSKYKKTKREDLNMYNFITLRSNGTAKLCYDQLEYVVDICNNLNIEIHPLLIDMICNNIFFDKIDFIDDSESEVYDISINNDDHSFIANGIVNHNCQGSTLDYAIIDLGSSLFCPGMGYVSLSRCRSLEGIYIIGLMETMIRADPTALEFEQELLKNSTIAQIKNIDIITNNITQLNIKSDKEESPPKYEE